MKQVNQDFLNGILRLDPIQLIGVAKILGIEVLKEDETFLPFDELIVKMFEAYDDLPRRRRRNLKRILRAKESESK